MNIKNTHKKPAGATTGKDRDKLSRAVRDGIYYKLSPKALTGAEKTVALLTTALSFYNEYQDELKGIELDPETTLSLLDPSQKWSEIGKHKQNVFRDLLRKELNEYKSLSANMGKIMRAHCAMVEKNSEETQERIIEHEEQIYNENPELVKALAKLPEFNEFKVAADLLEFASRGAGIVEVAEYVKKNIVNLGLKLYLKRYEPTN